MFKRLLTRLSLIAAMLGLAACATVPQGLNSVSDQSAPQGITKKVSLGSMIAVPENSDVEGGQAKVVDEYFSASGRHCVRVEIEGAGNNSRVICEREGGNWSFTRSLFNNEVPTTNNDLLIKTPLDRSESSPAEQPEVDHSSIADVLGTEFGTHYAELPSYNSDSVWDFAGTSTAGPEKWTQLALAAVPVLRELVGFTHNDEPITGRR